jgi:hypothetical protein
MSEEIAKAVLELEEKKKEQIQSLKSKAFHV